VRYVTVVIRVALDKEGELIQGEFAETGSARELRFVNWRELSHHIERWIASQPQARVADSKA
jgi:hypothetical protein